MSRVYVGIEDIGLTVAQRNTLIAGLKLLGPASSPSPAKLCHWRVRLDGLAALFEADFGENEVTIEGVKGYLASIFGIDAATISHSVVSSAYGPVVTFNRNGNKLRLVQFGGVSPTWAESGNAARAYLKANSAEWETP